MKFTVAIAVAALATGSAGSQVTPEDIEQLNSLLKLDPSKVAPRNGQLGGAAPGAASVTGAPDFSGLDPNKMPSREQLSAMVSSAAAAAGITDLKAAISSAYAAATAAPATASAAPAGASGAPAMGDSSAAAPYGGSQGQGAPKANGAAAPYGGAQGQGAPKANSAASPYGAASSGNNASAASAPYGGAHRGNASEPKVHSLFGEAGPADGKGASETVVSVPTGGYFGLSSGLGGNSSMPVVAGANRAAASVLALAGMVAAFLL